MSGPGLDAFKVGARAHVLAMELPSHRTAGVQVAARSSPQARPPTPFRQRGLISARPAAASPYAKRASFLSQGSGARVPGPWLDAFKVGRPFILAGNSTHTIPHKLSKYKGSGLPMDCADTAASDGRRDSNVYEVNTWLWNFGRGKPRLPS